MTDDFPFVETVPNTLHLSAFDDDSSNYYLNDNLNQSYFSDPQSQMSTRNSTNLNENQLSNHFERNHPNRISRQDIKAKYKEL